MILYGQNSHKRTSIKKELKKKTQETSLEYFYVLQIFLKDFLARILKKDP